MSDLAYHIATEHKLRFHEPSLTTTCSLPTCGMEPRLVYDESSLATVQAHHVAQVTEAAVREQIAAERDALAAKVERVRALHFGEYVEDEDQNRCFECGDDWPCPTIRALDTTPDTGGES